jgi:hypothetical protein
MPAADTWGAGPHTPSSARVHNYWLGGTFCTAADERKAAEIEQICPPIRQMAADSRLFTARVTAWAASELRIGQFLDLGAGVPAGEAVHQIAASVRPGARTVYADADAEVVDYLRDVALDGRQHEGAGVIAADLSGPEAVLADPELLRVIDPSRPVCVLLCLVLQAWPPGEARDLVGAYARLIAPGSCVAVTAPRIGDDLMWERLAAAYGVRSHNFTVQEFGALFGGLGIVPPGIGPAGKLRPGWGDMCGRNRGPAYVIAGAGIKRGKPPTSP